MKPKRGRPKKYDIRKMSLGPRKTALFLHELIHSDGIEVENIGIFTLKDIPAKKTFNNFSNKKLVFPAHRKVKFRPSQFIKSQI